MMIDWASSRRRGDAAAQSIQAGPRPGPARQDRERLTADWRELAAIMPHLVSWAPARCLADCARMATIGGRVQAADSASSPSSARMWQACLEELAGLGEGGALAVLAVLDRGVVAMIGGRRAGVGLPASYTAQRSTGGPCRDSRPGGPLGSEDHTVTSSPANRTALRGGGEPARAAQPAGHRQRGGRADPVQPLGEHLRPGQVPGGVHQPVPHHLQPGLQGAGHL